MDDVVALTAIAFAVRAVARGSWVPASLAMAVAVDSKAWAAVALPLAAGCARARVRGVALAIACAAAAIVPFILWHHGVLDAGSLNLSVDPDSGLHYLGVAAGSRPAWSRELQLAIGFPLGLLAMARGKWYLVPLIALAVRVNLDPETWAYYLTGPVFGLFVWDLFRPSRTSGVRSVVGCLALLIVPTDLKMLHVGGVSGLLSAARLVALLGPLVALANRGKPQLEVT